MSESIHRTEQPHGIPLMRRKRTSQTAVGSDSPSGLAGEHHGIKRARRNTAPADYPDVADLPRVTVPSEVLDPDHTQQEGFSIGAIIAMRMVNFQVSQDATYRFGPYLNMILGTNGSGKSTIVTALFLLFQGRIRDLDRSNYADFVTFGKDRAVLSALIQTRAIDRKPNCIVTMIISSSKRQASPQWYVDTKAVSESEFSGFIRSYHIQVNNLSQFLPQMRISSFAGLSPEERLKSIEEAVGYDGMLDDHILLSERGEEIVNIDRDVELYEKRLSILEKRKSDLDDKMQKLVPLHEEKNDLEFSEQVLKLAEYNQVKDEINQLKESLRSAQHDLRAFDTAHSNIKEQIDEASEKIAQLGESQESDALLLAKNTFRKEHSSSQSARKLLRNQVEKIKALKQDRAERARKIEALEKDQLEARRDIKRFRRALNEMGDSESFAAQEEKLSSLQEQRERTEAEIDRCDVRKRRLNMELLSLQENAGRFSKQLQILENSQTLEHRLGNVQKSLRWDRGQLENAVRFVRHNRHMFRMPIIEPAIISVEITDERLIPMIASVTQSHHMFKFVCQCFEDMKLLTRLAAEADGIELKTTLVESRAQPIPSSAREALQSAGFVGILLDGLSGPQPVLDFLSTLALGRTPFSFSPTTDLARQSLKRAFPIFNSFVDSEMNYSFVKSKYGRRVETETSQRIGSAPDWVKFMMRHDTNSERASLRSSVQALEGRIAELQSTLSEIENQRKLLDAEVTSAKQKLTDTTREVKRFKAAQERLRISTSNDEKTREKLQRSKAEESDCLSRLAMDMDELRKAVAETMSNGLNAKELGTLLQSSRKRTVSKLHEIDLKNKIRFLSEALVFKRKSCEIAVSNIESELSARQRATSEQRNQADEAVSWLRAHRKLEIGVNRAREASVADLQMEIGRLQSSIDMRKTQGESLVSVKQKLDTVITEIQDLERKKALSFTRRSNVSSEIASVRLKWESALEKLVESSSSGFSNMFKKLGCSGSVSIAKTDPLAVGTWGLDVKVAFREGEDEQALSRNRQSGGERSVTTAVYLMSLQSMAQAPFRVLDEINQGMDEHNEKRTMAFLVNITCNVQKAQQYFVISPKLLFDMPYHFRMNVNFIMSSENIESSDTLLPSFMDEQVLEGLLKDEHDSD